MSAAPSDAEVQLDAVRDVLRAISRSPLDTEAVLRTACDHAVRLCGADFGYVHVLEGGELRLVGSARAPDAMLGYMREHPIPIDRQTASGRAMMTGRVEQIADVLADPEWAWRDAQRLGGYRSTLAVPLRNEGRLIGAFSIGRMAVGAFTERDTELVSTFAHQAAMVIDHVRLVTTIERQRQELSHFLPSTVAELMSSPDGAQLLAAHRREISAMFCDLRGFTAFTEAAEPEEVVDVLGTYQREVGQIVLAHGGTLEHYAGDGIMAFLNDPKSVPDHPLVAVSMSLEIQRRFAERARRWARSGFDLGLGIGLSTGYATVGRVGFEGYYLYAAIGSVANLAARLCGIARAGQVVASGRLYGVVESDVDAEPLGAAELKGFSRPIEAYLVTRLKALSSE